MIKTCDNCANRFDCCQYSECNFFNKTDSLLDLWRPTIDLFDELLEENKNLDQARCNEIREKTELGLTYRNQIRILEDKIKELSFKIWRLEGDKEELELTLDNELEEQSKRINKMKCCGNCKYSEYGYVCKKPEFDCDGIDKWKLTDSSNKHTGGSLDDFLKEEGMLEEVTDKALKGE